MNLFVRVGSQVLLVFLTGANAEARAEGERTNNVTSLASATAAMNEGRFAEACKYFKGEARDARGHALAAWCFHWWAEGNTDPDEEDAHRDAEILEWSIAKAMCAKSSDCETSADASRAAAISHGDARKTARRVADLEARLADAEGAQDALRALAIDLGFIAKDETTTEEFRAFIENKISEMKAFVASHRPKRPQNTVTKKRSTGTPTSGQLRTEPKS